MHVEHQGRTSVTEALSEAYRNHCSIRQANEVLCVLCTQMTGEIHPFSIYMYNTLRILCRMPNGGIILSNACAHICHGSINDHIHAN